MAIKKAPVKAKVTPTVTVQTKKIVSEETCCMGEKCSPKHIIKIGMMVLTVLNTVLLVAILGNQDKAEALKVGGSENYKMLKQIFTTEGYKEQQKQQIEQALQMFANPEAAAQMQQAQPAVQQQAQPAAQQQAQPIQ